MPRWRRIVHGEAEHRRHRRSRPATCGSRAPTRTATGRVGPSGPGEPASIRAGRLGGPGWASRSPASAASTINSIRRARVAGGGSTRTGRPPGQPAPPRAPTSRRLRARSPGRPRQVAGRALTSPPSFARWERGRRQASARSAASASHSPTSRSAPVTVRGPRLRVREAAAFSHTSPSATRSPDGTARRSKRPRRRTGRQHPATPSPRSLPGPPATTHRHPTDARPRWQGAARHRGEDRSFPDRSPAGDGRYHATPTPGGPAGAWRWRECPWPWRGRLARNPPRSRMA